MPVPAMRPFIELQQHCMDRGAHLDARLLGTWPDWPETLSGARHRYARRFLTYLRRGTKTNRNFVMVTHADCVGVAFNLMPAQANMRVESVDYGGLFKAKRLPLGRPPGERSAPTGKPGRFSKPMVAWDSVMPRSNSAAPLREVNHEAELPDDITCLDGQAEPSSRSCSKDAELPRPATGWQVETEKLVIRRRHGNQQGTTAKLANRVKKIAQNSSFTWKEVEELLGAGLTDQSLGHCVHTGSDDIHRTSSRHLSRMTDVSFSTCVFGEASDLDPVSVQASLTDTPEVNASFRSTVGRDPIDDLLAKASTDQLSSRSVARAISMRRTLRPKLDHKPGRASSIKPEREWSLQLGDPKTPDLRNLKESALLARRSAKSCRSACRLAATSHNPSASAETVKGPSTGGGVITTTTELQTVDVT